MLLSESFEFTAAVRGFHFDRNVWTPQLNENLDCHHEEVHLLDIFVIKTCCKIANQNLGYLPREISWPAKYLLERGAVLTATLLSDRYRRSPLYQDGLEMHCNVKVTITDVERGHALINTYSESVSKLYCELEEDMSVGRFTEPESNVNLQSKRSKFTEKTHH